MLNCGSVVGGGGEHDGGVWRGGGVKVLQCCGKSSSLGGLSCSGWVVRVEAVELGTHERWQAPGEASSG